jgi:plasmid stability protein
MASNTVAVRLPDEVLEELQKRSAAQKRKVSDVVRDLIVSGLKADTPDRTVMEGLQKLEELGLLATKAALKAQFLANMSASFSVDVSRLMSGNKQPTGEEKNEFLAQMDGWAEDFAWKTMFGEERKEEDRLDPR